VSTVTALWMHYTLNGRSNGEGVEGIFFRSRRVREGENRTRGFSRLRFYRD